LGPLKYPFPPPRGGGERRPFDMLVCNGIQLNPEFLPPRGRGAPKGRRGPAGLGRKRRGGPAVDTLRCRCWAGLLAAAVVLTACGGGGGGAAAGPIKVGYSMTQTGPNAPPAEYELHGYQLAVDQINAGGGVLGRKLQL